jgi:hypothetical protein
MKKISKPVMIGAAGLLMLAMAGCQQGEKPVEVKPVQTPSSSVQKEVKASDPKKPQEEQDGAEFQTGWTQLENSIELSLSGPENCLPTVDRAVVEDKTVSIWLKDMGDDCANTNVITYSTIDDAKDIERVQVYEAGYDYSFELNKKE